MFQFEQTTAAGVNYVYTTDFCIANSGVTCPLASQGITYQGEKYKFDGIAFYVSANVPVMAPSTPVVPPKPEIVPPIIYDSTYLESSGRPLDFINNASAIVPAPAVDNPSPLIFSNTNYSATLTMAPQQITNSNTYAPSITLPYTANCNPTAGSPLQCKVEINASDFTEKQENLFDFSPPSGGVSVVFGMDSLINGYVAGGFGSNTVTTISPGYTYTGGAQSAYPYVCVYSYSNQAIWSSGPGNCY